MTGEVQILPGTSGLFILKATSLGPLHGRAPEEV
jgi:hypothetical protein